MNRRNTAIAPAILMFVFVTGCQSGFPMVSVAQAVAGAQKAIASEEATTVRVSLAGLSGWWKGRRLHDVDGAAIVQVRLTATGPGIASPITATALFDTEAESLPAVPMTGEISVTVPAGKNRIFVLEGLDADGRVIAVMRTLGSLAGGNRRLTINADTDAAARVLASLLAGPQDGDAVDTAGVGVTLAAEDIAEDLLAFVNGLTQYNAATNTYSGAVPPVNFRDRVLADLLRADGRTVLEAAPSAEVQDTAGSTIPVRVVENGSPVADATVTLFDPYHSPVQTDADGQASFTSVPPGTWTLVAQAGGTTVSTTVQARDQETAELRLLDLATVATLALPTVPAVSEWKAFPFAKALRWGETPAAAASTTFTRAGRGRGVAVCGASVMRSAPDAALPSQSD